METGWETFNSCKWALFWGTKVTNKNIIQPGATQTCVQQPNMRLAACIASKHSQQFSHKAGARGGENITRRNMTKAFNIFFLGYIRCVQHVHFEWLLRCFGAVLNLRT